MNKAFTLIELLVVVAIIGILAAVGVKRRALRSIIEDFKIMFYELNIDYLKYFYNNYYTIK